LQKSTFFILPGTIFRSRDFYLHNKIFRRGKLQCAESLIAQFDAALNYERDDDIQKGMLITDMKTLRDFLLITGIV